MTEEPPQKPPNEAPSKPPEQGQVRAPAPEQGRVDGPSVQVPPAILAQLQYPPGPGALIGLQQALQIWQSPYPPPDAIERYEKINPGSFDRILKMVERLQAAQIEQTRIASQFTQNDTRRAQWLGFAVAITALLGALACLLLEYPWVAAVFLSVPVMTVARALIDSATAPSKSQPSTTQSTTIPSPAPDTRRV
jgi:uncharacterized membrane protein